MSAYYPHIIINSKIMGGSPHIEGSKIPVRRLWHWHRIGTTVETLLRRYPQLGEAKVLSALAFAYDNKDLIQADMKREEELVAKTRTK